VAVGLVTILVAAWAVTSRGGGSSPTAAPVITDPVAERGSVIIGAGGLKLAGTLAVPGDGRTPAAAVLIVSGSAAIDRNTVADPGGTADPLYRDLGRRLAEAGIASFRYDRRGTDSAKLKADQKLTFEDLVADANAGVSFLGERKETAGVPVVILGHDTGGVVAMREAAADPRVRGVVLASTASRSLVDVLADDFVRTDPNGGPALATALRDGVDHLNRTGELPKPESLPLAVRAVFVGDAAYVRQLLTLDPMADAARLRVPGLVVRGGADQTVLSSDVVALAGVFTAGGDYSSGGATDHNLAFNGGHTHEFAEQIRDDPLIAKIAEWVKAHV